VLLAGGGSSQIANGAPVNSGAQDTADLQSVPLPQGSDWIALTARLQSTVFERRQRASPAYKTALPVRHGEGRQYFNASSDDAGCFSSSGSARPRLWCLQ
jgi:hypothetical protein